MTLALSGCFQKASVGVWQAAQASLPGSGQVGLVGVEDDSNGVVGELLSTRLESYANWSVISVDQFQTIQLVSGSDKPDISELIEVANTSDVALLISGSVREAGIEAPAVWNPFQPETIAKVSLQLAAYSTSGDDARTSETITKTAVVPPGTTELSDDLFRKLASAAVDEFLLQFRPKNGSLTLDLATPSFIDPARRQVRLGNIAAARGQWNIATEYYKQAIDRNPACDPALFNLSLAAVCDRRFEEAKALALQALRLRHDNIYVEGLAAIQELADEDSKVRYQTGES